MTKVSAKVQAAELLAQGQMTQPQVAEAVGVHATSVGRWMKEPHFVAQVIERSRAILKESLPLVYSALLQECIQGRHQSIKILLDHVDRLEEAKAQADMGTITFTWRSGSSVPHLEAIEGGQ